MNFTKLLTTAINSAIQGGHAIMKVYGSDFEIEHKDDNSPLTLADKNCHLVIERFLSSTNIPILSEEVARFLLRKEINGNISG